MSETLRLFFAVPVAPARVPSLQALHTQQHRRDGWRWPAKKSWHITVAFLGAIDSELLPLLYQLGHNAAARCAAGHTRLTRFEYWPTAHHPRLLVATGEPSPSLANLHATLNAGLAKQTLPCETRPFRPHLTLARLKRGARLFDELPALAEEIPVEQLALYRSDPGEQGSIYRIIWQTRLQSPGG